jgi:hypothetical protein
MARSSESERNPGKTETPLKGLSNEQRDDDKIGDHIEHSHAVRIRELSVV